MSTRDGRAVENVDADEETVYVARGQWNDVFHKVPDCENLPPDAECRELPRSMMETTLRECEGPDCWGERKQPPNERFTCPYCGEEEILLSRHLPCAGVDGGEDSG